MKGKHFLAAEAPVNEDSPYKNKICLKYMYMCGSVRLFQQNFNIFNETELKKDTYINTSNA